MGFTVQCSGIITKDLRAARILLNSALGLFVRVRLEIYLRLFNPFLGIENWQNSPPPSTQINI